MSITVDEIKFLMERGVLKEGSSVLKFINMPSYKDYKLIKVNVIDDNTASLIVEDIDNRGRQYRLNNKCLSSIDDMNIDRVISAYSVSEELKKIEFEEPTDVMGTVVGKDNAEINGIALENDMIIVLHNDATLKMNEKQLTVKGVGESIKLVAPRGRPRKQTV